MNMVVDSTSRFHTQKAGREDSLKPDRSTVERTARRLARSQPGNEPKLLYRIRNNALIEGLFRRRMWEERGRRGRESGPCGTGHCRQPANEKLRTEPASSLDQEPARVLGPWDRLCCWETKSSA